MGVINISQKIAARDLLEADGLMAGRPDLENFIQKLEDMIDMNYEVWVYDYHDEVKTAKDYITYIRRDKPSAS